MMIDADQEMIATQYNLLSFDILVLDPNKTLCEKIMSLVRFSNSNDAIDNLKLKIRHLYDLNQLLLNEDISSFFNSSDFEVMLKEVAKSDMENYLNERTWLIIHPKESIIFKDYKNVWKEISPMYNADFKNLVYGQLPNDSEILLTMKRIKDRIADTSWDLQ